MRRPGHCRGCLGPVPALEVRRSKIAALANGLSVDTVNDLMPRCRECLETSLRRLISEGDGDD